MDESGESDKPHRPLERQNYYHRLGLTKDATKDEIGHAFRTLSKTFHTDTGRGNEEAMRLISEAYATLKDEKKRQNYDREVISGAGSTMFSGMPDPRDPAAWQRRFMGEDPTVFKSRFFGEKKQRQKETAPADLPDQSNTDAFIRALNERFRDLNIHATGAPERSFVKPIERYAEFLKRVYDVCITLDRGRLKQAGPIELTLDTQVGVERPTQYFSKRESHGSVDLRVKTHASPDDIRDVFEKIFAEYAPKK